MASLFGNRFSGRSKDDPPEEPPKPPAPVQMTPRSPTVTPQPLGFETVLGSSSVLDGRLKSDGNIRLDGTFTGTLEISGNVLVGETANIQADIDAKNISIAGTVRGNVSGNKVQLLRTGRVWGDITATALTTEEGAFIDGKISMKSTLPPPEPTATEAETTPAEAIPTEAPIVDEESPAEEVPSVEPEADDDEGAKKA